MLSQALRRCFFKSQSKGCCFLHAKVLNKISSSSLNLVAIRAVSGQWSRCLSKLSCSKTILGWLIRLKLLRSAMQARVIAYFDLDTALPGNFKRKDIFYLSQTALRGNFKAGLLLEIALLCDAISIEVASPNEPLTLWLIIPLMCKCRLTIVRKETRAIVYL